MKRALKALLVLAIFVSGVQVGIHHGRWLVESQEK